MRTLVLGLVSPAVLPPLGDPPDGLSTVELSDPGTADTAALDCVLCPIEPGWEERVRSLRSSTPGLPVVLVGDADPRAGALASRLGVEYAPTAALADGETPWSRVVAAVARRDNRESEPASVGGEYHRRVLDRVTDGCFAVDERWRFTYLNDAAFEVIAAAAETPVDRSALLGRSLWAVAPEALGTVFERQYRQAMDGGEAVSFEAFYEPLGTRFEVTAYPDETGLSVLFTDVTERRRREDGLERLLATTRELLTVDTTDDIPDIVAQAAADVLDLEYGLVRLHDPERDVLVPAGASEAVERRMVDRPVYDADEGMPGQAFQRGETVEYDGDEAALPDGQPAAIIVPLDEYGTLTVGTGERDRLTGTDRLLVSLLATSAVTALDRAERLERLETYRAIHENVKERLYVLDEEGVIRLTTDSLLEELGYSATEVVGRPVEEFLPDDAVATGRGLLADLRRAPDDASRTLTTTIRARDGREIPVDIEISLLPGGEGGERARSVGVVRDRSALETERARFESLFDRSPDAIVDAVLTDDGPRVRAVNSAFEETFGVDGDAVRGDDLDDHLVPPDAREEAARLNRQTAEGFTEPREVDRRTPDGTGTFLFRGVTYSRTPDDIRAFGIYTDISDRKTRERQIGMLNRVLRHNLRNEVTVLSGSLDLLAAVAGDEARAHLDRAAGAVDRLDGLSENVRRIQRSLGTDPAATMGVDLATLAAEAGGHARERNPDATVDVAVPSVRVRGNESLGYAITGLVENAAVHAGASPTVTVTATVEDAQVALRVADDGPGIPARERAVITGDTDITQLAHSRGLGLWQAYYAVTAVGGSLSFADPSTVVLTLPRETGDDRDPGGGADTDDRP